MVSQVGKMGSPWDRLFQVHHEVSKLMNVFQNNSWYVQGYVTKLTMINYKIIVDNGKGWGWSDLGWVGTKFLITLHASHDKTL